MSSCLGFAVTVADSPVRTVCTGHGQILTSTFQARLETKANYPFTRRNPEMPYWSCRCVFWKVYRVLKGKGTHRTKETNHTSSRAREQCEAIDGHVCACVWGEVESCTAWGPFQLQKISSLVGMRNNSALIIQRPHLRSASFPHTAKGEKRREACEWLHWWSHSWVFLWHYSSSKL